MDTKYSGGYSGYGRNSGYGGAAVIIIVIVIIIIIIIAVFAFSGFRNKDCDKSKFSKRGKRRGGYDDRDDQENGMNGMNGGIDPKCDVAAICREAFKTGEAGAKKILNETLDFLDNNPTDLGPLGDVSNNFDGYPIVIRPGDTVAESTILFHINPNLVGVPVGSLGSSEVHDSTSAILQGAQEEPRIVCYQWQGRTKMTLVSRSRDGKLVVGSGFHLDSTQ